MSKYKVTLNGKTYNYNGNHTDDVAVKMSNRMVFGSYLITNMRLKMYDADTRGENWAVYEADGNKMMIDKI
jgi:hypothetical protein